MVVVGIGGEPATGKTTLMRRVIERLGSTSPMTFKGGHRKGKRVVQLSMRVEVIEDAAAFVLGSYQGDGFDGTDRLSMAVQPLAVQFLRWVAKERPGWAVLFEGDRLYNAGFLERAREAADETLFIVVTAEQDEQMRRHLVRGDEQPERFLKSRRTKVANLLLKEPDLEVETNDDDADTLRIVERIVVFLRGGGRHG